jgi:hypothetical protein
VHVNVCAAPALELGVDVFEFTATVEVEEHPFAGSVTIIV